MLHTGDRASDPKERALDPIGRVSEPAGKPARRLSEPAGRLSEPAGRLGGRGDGNQNEKKIKSEKILRGCCPKMSG